MRADENAAIVRRGYEAFNSADMNTLTEIFDESAVWHVPGRSSLANDYQGRDATFAYFGRLGQETGAPTGPNWTTCLPMTTTAWLASTARPRSERVSAFKMIPPVWSSSSRTAG
jgi:ketosteroid isomerase-like protein